MPIRGVIIDGFSTLFSAPNLFCGPEVAERIKKYGYTVDSDRINAGIDKFWVLAEKNGLSDLARWGLILRDFGRIPEPIHEAILECILAETSVVMRDCYPLSGMYDTLVRIRAKLPIALCSNASHIHLMLEEQLGLRGIFGRGFVVSYERQTSKENPGIFRMAAQAIELAPADCLFVDDGLTHLETAKGLGMTTVLALTAPEARKRHDLKREQADPNCPFSDHIGNLGELVDRVLPALGVEI